MIYLFLVLTILNLPTFFFYQAGNYHETVNQNAFEEAFAMFSLANIGQNQYACQKRNFKED